MFNLKFLREYEDYSMSQIANKLNIAKSTYASWEWEVAVIPLKHLVNLANIYHVNIDFVLQLSKQKLDILETRKIDSKSISKHLKEIRLENHLSQKQLGNIVHFSDSNISDYERGKILISTSCLYELCKKYKISADYILGFSNKKELAM